MLWIGKGNTWKTISLGDVIEPKQVRSDTRGIRSGFSCLNEVGVGAGVGVGVGGVMNHNIVDQRGL